MGEEYTDTRSNECWKSGPKPAGLNSSHLIMDFLPKQVYSKQGKIKSRNM